MAFKLHLYTNKSAKNVINKTLTNEKIITGGFFEETNLSKPVIRFDYNILPDEFNYAYIPKFHRYYYANVNTKPGNGSFGGIMELECDVLMSYKDAILSSDVEVSESNIYNQRVENPSVETETRSQLEVKQGQAIQGRHAIFISV